MTLSRARLLRLVKHRERLERIQEGQLAARLRRQSERAAALDATLHLRTRVLALPAPASGPVDLLALEAVSASVVRFDREANARRAALEHSRREVEDARHHLMERRRDRKAMEHLLDRRLEQERIQRERVERQLMDEIATTRWLRQQSPHEGGHSWH